MPSVVLPWASTPAGEAAVPVTVKFSEQFYRKLGHEAVDELVNWFNQVDGTYRGDLRELNEQNFARFDAKLEQRLAQLDAKLEQRAAQLDAKLEQRVGQLDAKLDQRVAELEARLGERLAGLRADLRDELHAQGRMLLLWMVGLWITAVAAQYFLPAARP
jgi:DNA anti-recombination protein RmuC